MSILKKSGLPFAIAMAMGFGLASPAMATTFTTANPVLVAYTTVVGGAANVSTQNYAVNIQAGDNQVGRTTGFNALLTLDGTAKFAVTPNVAPGAADAGWTVQVVAGGVGTNYVQVLVSPPSGGQITLNDSVIVLSNVQLSNASVLASVGGAVSLSGAMHDANTGFAVGTPFSGAIVAGADPLKVTYAANAANYQLARIDVGTGKVGFSDNGQILSTTTGPGPDGTFDAGTLTLSGVANLLNATDSSSFVFNPTTDTFKTTLQGTFGTAFGPASGAITLADQCYGWGTTHVSGTTTPSSSTFNYVLNDLGVSTLPVTEHVCFNANGSDVILASAVGASTLVDAGTAQSGTLLPLQYNGSVLNVLTFNPAGNTMQQSFLRVVNPSSVDGKVTIVGTDDAGHVGGPVTFTLGAGQGMQLNGDLLTNGGPNITGMLGTSTGKWRLDVTGEFDNMRVQSLMRNNSDGTVTNLSGEVIDLKGTVNKSLNEFFHGY